MSIVNIALNWPSCNCSLCKSVWDHPRLRIRYSGCLEDSSGWNKKTKQKSRKKCCSYTRRIYIHPRYWITTNASPSRVVRDESTWMRRVYPRLQLKDHSTNAISTPYGDSPTDSRTCTKRTAHAIKIFNIAALPEYFKYYCAFQTSDVI